MINHLEPDILEWEVRWDLGSITTNKASRGDGIPVELFQILKDEAPEVLHPICYQLLENSAVATRLENVNFHSIVFLYFFALTTEDGFLFCPCYSLELCIQMGISFPFLWMDIE